MRTEYDFVFAGGGLSGICLAYLLTLSPLKNIKIAIIDRNLYHRANRSWSYWTSQPTEFDHLVKKSWKQMQIYTKAFHRVWHLDTYTFSEVHSSDFFSFLMEHLRKYDVDFIEDTITAIQDGEKGASVKTLDKTFQGTWVFDSAFLWDSLKKSTVLYMYGEVWNIKTHHASFIPSIMTFFDFRGPTNGPFFYVLPYSETEASITCTYIDTLIETLQKSYFQAALKS